MSHLSKFMMGTDSVRAAEREAKKLRKVRIPIDRCAEYEQLCREDNTLAQLFKQIDDLLNTAVELGDKYDAEHETETSESRWGNKALRCRLVLGMD